MDFKSALKIVLLFEGGYVNDPKDAGGETNYGITKAVAVENGYHGDMKSLPLSVVERIYKTKYWDAVKCDSLPSEIRLSMFDSAVNSGIGYSIKWLQRAVGVRDDGIFGDKTSKAVHYSEAKELHKRMCAERLLSVATFSGFSHFGPGWIRRIALILKGGY